MERIRISAGLSIFVFVGCVLSIGYTMAQDPAKLDSEGENAQVSEIESIAGPIEESPSDPYRTKRKSDDYRVNKKPNWYPKMGRTINEILIDESNNHTDHGGGGPGIQARRLRPSPPNNAKNSIPPNAAADMPFPPTPSKATAPPPPPKRSASTPSTTSPTKASTPKPPAASTAKSTPKPALTSPPKGSNSSSTKPSTSSPSTNGSSTVDTDSEEGVTPPSANASTEPIPIILEGDIPCEIREDPEDKDNDIDRKWKTVNIFVVKQYSQEHIKVFNETLNVFREAAPCLRINVLIEDIAERPTTGTYLELDYEHDGPCYSYVGQTKSESQMLGLPPACMTPELIAHEFMHALGFHHEQNRPDRNKFVDVYWHNFHPGMAYSSYEIKPEAVTIGPYDFESILHFKPTGNTIEGGPTMKSKTGEPLGSKDGKLTELDKEKIRLLYCPNMKPGQTTCNKKLAKYLDIDSKKNNTK